MTIETKFNIGDTIHFLHNNKALHNIIRGFRIEFKSDANTQKQPQIIYLCGEENEKQVFIKVNEDEGFPSKEKLLKSL